MISLSLPGLCLLSLAWATAAVQSHDHLVVFALPRDRVTLPCGVPSVRSCSSVSWSVTGGFVTEVVRAGVVTAQSGRRFGLLQDCSLELRRPVLDDALLYSCYSGALSSSVSLQILQITESSTPAEDKIELQCFLNTYKGYVPCNNTGIHMKWSTEDDTQLNGNRFQVKNPSECFSKLIIRKKITDHHRKWKCQLTQSDKVTASITYTTTIPDGREEVFATVGESVSLSCSNTSSLADSGSVEWAIGGRPLTQNTSAERGQSEPPQVNKDSSLFFSKVRAVDAGDYTCSESTGQKTVLNRIRLHTLDVTSQCGPGGLNFTLTCELTCTNQCEEDVILTWSGGSQDSWQSGLMNGHNMLTNKLFLPVCSVGRDEVTCSVHREGAVMASKTWPPANSLQTLALLALPLGLLICIVCGGVFVYMKRKRNKDAANEQSSTEMTHVYEVVQDVSSEVQPQRQSNAETATASSFYDLLQAVD